MENKKWIFVVTFKHHSYVDTNFIFKTKKEAINKASKIVLADKETYTITKIYVNK